MRFADIIISAVIGGAIGFAASHYVSGQPDTNGYAADMADARIDERLKMLGLENKGDLDSKISGSIAQFLSDQPEAIVAALEQHQTNLTAREAEDLRKTVTNLGSALTAQSNDPAIGADLASAEVTLVEFFDYRCGYCKRSLENVMTLVKDDPTLRVVMKEFPILGPESVVVTRVSLAANSIDPSRYSDLHSALMTHRGGYDKASLLAVVAENGYDPAKVEEAMGSQGVSEQIKNAYEIAEALGIRGTPAFVIGDRVIPGAVSTATLREAIETARGASKG
ncbi:MAG: DsbA family protein [Alphaproteobacteria bacterium]